MQSIEGTNGFLVADARGHPVGRVECPLYGSSEDEPDALAVRSGFLIHHHFLVPATAIVEIDQNHEAIALRFERRQLQRFL
jgi:hypothetical protein